MMRNDGRAKGRLHAAPPHGNDVMMRNDGQTKGKLGNSEVKGIVDSFSSEALGVYLEENPDVAKRIIDKIVDAGRAREAARAARRLERAGGPGA